MTKIEEQVEERIALRQYYQLRYTREEDSFLARSKQTLNNFAFDLLDNSAEVKAKVFKYFQALEPEMDHPIAHIFGSGGKSHLAMGMAKWIILNGWQLDSNLRSYIPFSYVLWPNWFQEDMAGSASGDWSTPLMIIDQIDQAAPVTSRGYTFWTEKLDLKLEHRIRLGLPTIVISKRSPKALSTFLSENAQGKSFEASKALAQSIALKLSGASKVTIGLKGKDLREIRMNDAGQADAMLEILLSSQALDFQSRHGSNVLWGNEALEEPE